MPEDTNLGMFTFIFPSRVDTTTLSPNTDCHGTISSFYMISNPSSLFLPSSMKFILNNMSPLIPHFSPFTFNFFPGNIPFGTLTAIVLLIPLIFNVTFFVVPLYPSSIVRFNWDS